MGGNTRNPKSYIFKKPIPKAKETEDSKPKRMVPAGIELGDYVFGKTPKPKNPKVK